MDGKPRPGRGRAALKEALKKSLRRPGEDEAASTSAQSAQAEAPEAPKPRGRAQLFQKLKMQPTQPATQPIVKPTEIPKTPEPVAAMAKLQIKEPEFKKSEKGTSGAPIAIMANYLKLIREEEKGFHKYEVKFSPHIDSTFARVKLIKANVPKLGGVHMFNGAIDLYLPVQLPDPEIVFETPHPFDPETIVTLTIIYKNQEPFGSRESLHFLNVLFKRVMNKLTMNPIGRNYFDMSSAKYIPTYALEVIPGYAVAVDAMEGGLMLCLDTCHKFLRKQTVLEVLGELSQKYPRDFRTKAYDDLLGTTILTRYSNRNYIIDDIIWDANPTDTFETKNGPISYVEYFKKQHGLEIKNLKQPLLLNMRKKKTETVGKEEVFRICLIPELCNITGISQDMLTHKFRKDIAEYTRLTPAKRFDALRRYIQNVKNNPEANQQLKDWGFSIADGVIDLNARVIGDNKIHFKTKTIDIARTPDWGRDIGKDNLINPVDMKAWLVIYPERDRSVTDKFVSKLCQLARGFGCQIDIPKYVAIPGKGYDSEYRKALDANAHDIIQMILIVMPMPRESLYAEVKSSTLCRKGILSQGVLVRTLQNDKIFSAVALKLGLQMQAKMGGSLWAIQFPKACDDFMFCGIDTYHSKGNKKSVGALVCSIDENHTRFYTGLAFQAHEIADSLKLHFQTALEHRKKVTGKYPTTVFVVRDGVGDGALQHVKDYELQQYLSVAQETRTNFKMVFIVIQKRINTRFMARDGKNPPPGTVVDHTITRRQYEDYYLVPQGVSQGTVSPSHYIVLHNEAPQLLNLDRIQKLTYKLCHLYYNWSGAVSVPAPCQYAHKAAYLAGQFLERKPDERLADRLYYL